MQYARAKRPLGANICHLRLKRNKETEIDVILKVFRSNETS